MINIKDFSIKKKLIAIQLLTAFIVLLFYGIFLVFNDLQVLRKSIISQVTSMAQLIGANSISALNFLDNEAAEKILSSLAAEENIVNAWIYDADGNLFAKYSKTGYSSFEFPKIENESYEFGSAYTTLSKRIIQDRDIIGSISLRLSMRQFRFIVKQNIVVAFFVLAIGMIFAFILSIITQRTISNPVLNLVESSKEVSETGTYSIRVEKEGNDEIGILCDTFNDMMAQIEKREIERDKAEETLKESNEQLQQEITERKRAEEELAKHQEHLEELVETRTIELTNANKQLQQEITERKEAEDALRESEHGLAEAQRIAHLGNWDWNIITNELLWSDEIYRIFGLRPREFGATYDAFLNSVHPDDRESVKEAVNRSLVDPNVAYNMEHRVVRTDGSERVVHEQGEVIFDDTGKPIRMVCTVLDISERVQAAEALQYRLEFEGLVSGVSTRFINLKPESIDQGIEQALEEIGGFVNSDSGYVFMFSDDMKKFSMTHLWRDTNLTTRKSDLQNLDVGSMPWWMGKLTRPEPVIVASVDDLPQEAWVEKSIIKAQGIQSLVDVPIVYQENAIGFLGFSCVQEQREWTNDEISLLKIVGQVITNALQRKQAEEALKDTQAQLAQSAKMASLGMLVAGIAHEINTPIGSIHSMHDTLMRAMEKLKGTLESDFPKAYQENQRLNATLKIIEEANRVIEKGCERVITIVRRLRSFARLDEAELKTADIHEGLEDTLTIIHHEIKHHIKVKKDYGGIPPVACFPGRLNQVFLNILVNAKQAIKDKGEITITTLQKDNKVHIAIKDTGVGMSNENLEKIFDPGFTTKGVGVGTGLGLSICYQIIQDHKGDIKVESEVGKGSTFTIVLPMNLDELLEHT